MRVFFSCGSEFGTITKRVNYDVSTCLIFHMYDNTLSAQVDLPCRETMTVFKIYLHCELIIVLLSIAS